MKKIALLELNACLKIFWGSDGLYAHLAYTDYASGDDGGDAYLITHFIPYPQGFLEGSHIIIEDFFKSYLLTLQHDLEWELFDEEASLGDLLMPKEFIEEGRGIRKMDIVIGFQLVEILKQQLLDSFVPVASKFIPVKLVDIVASIREVCPEVSVHVQEQEEIYKVFAELAQQWLYDTVLLVDLNRRSSFANSLSTANDVNSMGHMSDNNEALFDVLDYDKLEPFMSVSIEKDKLFDMWANYKLAGTSKVFGGVGSDIMRAKIVSDLLAISGSRLGAKMLKDWQSASNNSSDPSFSVMDDTGRLGVFVVGEALKVLEARKLLVTLVDGLQLTGSFDLIYDKDNVLSTFGRSYLLGKSSTDVILHKDVLPIDMARVIVPEIHKRKKKKGLVLSGEIATTKKNEVFYGIPSQVYKVDIPGNEGATLKLKIKPGIGLSSYDDRIESGIKTLWLDCRYKPVQYGPGPKANKSNMMEWFNE